MRKRCRVGVWSRLIDVDPLFFALRATPLLRETSGLARPPPQGGGATDLRQFRYLLSRRRFAAIR